VAGKTSLTEALKRVSMGKGCLLSWIRCEIAATLSFSDNNGISYFYQAWLRKDTDLDGGKMREYKLK